MPAPDLTFGESTDRIGFTPAGIAAFQDLRPAVVVRELIQNSLDAALIDAQEQCAHVRFERGRCKLSEIPGIQSYRVAFRQAVETQPPSGVARTVIKRIARTLRQRSHEVLYVIDNGVGLDAKRMCALLSDGVSSKGGEASGTFGNGHSVVIPASNLRYVLYGGLTGSGRTYGAGQAVLASHRTEHDWRFRSGRGIYLKSFKPLSDDVPFTLATGVTIPSMVKSAINKVRSAYGRGAAVIIPTFNNFEHNDPLQTAVFKAASFSFFQAIYEGRLVVEIVDSTTNAVLNKATLRGQLALHQDEIRSTGGFLSGRRANEWYETLLDGEAHEIATTQGKVALRLLRRETGRCRVGLCRNGMWITDKLPLFQNVFADRQPFHALILLSPDNEGKFFNLIREAETPLHDKLTTKQMERSQKRRLEKALKEIRSGIEKLVPKVTEETYSPKDVLEFQFDAFEGQGRGGRQPAFWGRVGSIRPPMDSKPKEEQQESSQGRRGNGKNGSTRRDAQVQTRPIFRIASAPTGHEQRKIQVECTEQFDDAELRMFVDENVDATCDRQTRTQSTAVMLSNVKVDGRELPDARIVQEDLRPVGAKLGSITANTPVDVEVTYAIPVESISLPVGQAPAIRIEILKHKTDPTQ